MNNISSENGNSIDTTNKDEISTTKKRGWCEIEVQEEEKNTEVKRPSTLFSEIIAKQEEKRVKEANSGVSLFDTAAQTTINTEDNKTSSFFDKPKFSSNPFEQQKDSTTNVSSTSVINDILNNEAKNLHSKVRKKKKRGAPLLYLKALLHPPPL